MLHLSLSYLFSFYVQLGEYSSEFVSHVCKALIRNIWNVRSALLESLDKFFAKLDVATDEYKTVTEESLVLILDSLLEGALRDFKYIGLRNQGLDLVKAIIGKIESKLFFIFILFDETDRVYCKIKVDVI